MSEPTLEEWRSGRRLSTGASLQVRKSLEKQMSLCHLPNWKETDRKVGGSQTYISGLIDDLEWALTNLDASVDRHHLEEMANFIYESLSGDWQGYHNVRLLFQISAGSSPIQLLAASFRDTVDRFIDGELWPRHKRLLHNVFLPKTFKLNPALFDDEMMIVVATVFGYEANADLQQLTLNWRQMDYFLAAILAVKFLGKILTRKQLTELVACIEASIPFRETGESGELPVEKLYHRLVQVNVEHALGFSEAELELSCQQAADLRNRYLGNFATADPANYLDHLWNVLPEMYPGLRRHAMSSLDDFYLAVIGMRKFSALVKVRFATFRGVPPESEIQEIHTVFNQNLQLGLDYLKYKGLGLGTIVALATLTGSAHVPKSLFFGDMHPNEKGQMTLLAIPELESIASDCNPQIYHILSKGRGVETTFDHRNAPVAALVYGTLGEAGSDIAFEHCVYPMTVESSWTLLESLPYHLVETISHALASVAISRAELVNDLLRELAERTQSERA